MNRVADSAARDIGRLTAPALQTQITAGAVLCLPIGSQEQHGPHLPLNTDTVIAEQFTSMLADRYGQQYDLWTLPAIQYGLSIEHAWAPGTVSLRIASLTALLDAVITEHLRATASRRLLIVNGHGGNRGFLEPFLRELEHEHGIAACIIHPAALSTVNAGRQSTPEIHAGIHETAIMLALSPEHVHLDRLPADLVADTRPGIQDLILNRGATWPWSSADPAIANWGVIGGDPREAKSATGQAILDSALDEAERVLAHLTTRHRPEP